jgi:hypothetical protein
MEGMIQAEDIVGGEWAEWYRLSPLQRWHISSQLWKYCLQIGGSLDPEPDTESPFYDGRTGTPAPLHAQ